MSKRQTDKFDIGTNPIQKLRSIRLRTPNLTCSANSLERAKTSIDDHYECEYSRRRCLAHSAANSHILIGLSPRTSAFTLLLLMKTARLSFNLRSKPAQLVLDQVQREDEADYRCRVDFRRGRTVNTIISLRVIVPPEELYIVSSSKPQHRLTGLIGPFDEGSPLELICVANGGKPRPQISWRRDYQSMDGDTQSIDKNGEHPNNTFAGTCTSVSITYLQNY